MPGKKKRDPFNLKEVTLVPFSENTTIDRNAGTIGGICLIRSVSKNNRVYSEKALNSIKNIVASGCKSFLDHDGPFGNSSVKDLLGSFSNPRIHEDGVWADLKVLKSSPGKELIFEIADEMPDIAGFSINGRGKFSEEKDPEGREVVEDVLALRSVDFVGEPATTHGVFEAEENEDSEGAEAPIGEPYTIDNPPATVKNLPRGAQEIFISVFNSTVAGGESEDQARIAAWGAVKNKYSKGGDGKWHLKKKESTGGDLHMDKVLEYFKSKIKVEGLTDDGIQDAILEYVKKGEKELEVAQAGHADVSKKLTSIEETLQSTQEECTKAQEDLKTATAELDNRKAQEEQVKATKERKEMITKIAEEHKLEEKDMSETFTSQLMSMVGEDTEQRITDLIKDRKELLKSGEVEGMGAEQKASEEEKESKEDKDEEKDKDEFYAVFKRA